MSRYKETFEALKAAGKKAFIPFTLLGWPDKATSLKIINAMVEGGATCLELGLAFSDPLADGPIIQSAAMETLKTGFTVSDAFELVKVIRERHLDIPIGLLTYTNMVLARGKGDPGVFFYDAYKAGVDGVLIADLPLEMAQPFADAATKMRTDLIFLASPLTNEERLKAMAPMAGGFMYLVSRLGITGTEARYDDALEQLIENVHNHTPLPACVGFGISEPAQAREMIAKGADGVITGSKVIQLVRENLQDVAAIVKAYTQAMVMAIATSVPAA